jgi:hypothetical protein
LRQITVPFFLKKRQDGQEIKRRTKFEKELGICGIFGIGGGFLAGPKRNRTCHRIPHKEERRRRCGYEEEKGNCEKGELDKESKSNQGDKKA